MPVNNLKPSMSGFRLLTGTLYLNAAAGASSLGYHHLVGRCTQFSSCTTHAGRLLTLAGLGAL